MPEIIVALDVASAKLGHALVERLGEDADFYKVGSLLFSAAGPEFVRELRQAGKRVFLDLKYLDIPHTVAGAVEAAARLDVELLTLHASGGTAMMRAARDALGHDEGRPKLVGVTVLTSFTAAELELVWDKQLRSLREEVARLAGLAAAAGLDGVVASAREAESLKRRHGADFIVVTPGIRPAGTLEADQARTGTPAEAARAGADYLVIGRPVTAAADPAVALRGIRAEIAGRAPDELAGAPQTLQA
ncbi:MAG: orotidine-5'-phosphate decarboxylase [Longimicrobiales bacterium]